ncbi:sigma-70 family RNA polymerase sigma factor [Limnoglobus roseus]|uniref:RNA polymerase sigma factor SigM n=1 Tax=Limnoglobus roseus TaxID=2598579 RepID=A0A5C1AEY9_9BACT|nr:sigma-70 family RNA polymerase sigma factor [Limnoglobus roseus]QEL15694.1 RNA polymerase sigma factor SigM [Limnoglobus roseus]
MAGSRLSTLCRHFTAAVSDTAADAELLARFTANRDEAAFAVLVRRHGPMVWGVCRNLLPNAADADDAFQATFLALVRGAKAVRKPEALGAWLHGVAVRVAHKLRRTAARRNLREKKAAVGEAVRPVADSRWDEVLAAVHEEVNRLPDGERTAFVVCCLEGVRQPDAAAQLGWKPGTLTGRLSKAKQRLLDRLTRRGLAPAAALGALGLGATTGQAIVPTKLLDAVLPFASATATVPASVLQLSQGVLDMTITKVKFLAAAVLIAGGLATGLGANFFANADAQSAPPGGLTPPVAPGAPPAPPAPATPPVGVAPNPGYTPVAPKAAPTPQPMAGGMTGGITNGPVRRPWDYKFVDVSAMSVDELKKALAAEGDQSWELAALEHRQFPGSGVTSHLAVFKRLRVLSFGTTPDAAPGGSRGATPSNTPFPTPEPKIPPPTPVAKPVAPSPFVQTSPPGAPPIKVLKLHTISLKTANSVQMAKVLKELVAIQQFGDDVTAVIADEGSNSLLVRASDDGLKAVEKQVRQLEQAAAERINADQAKQDQMRREMEVERFKRTNREAAPETIPPAFVPATPSKP